MISAEQAVSFLKEGKVVALPTETVYGLAAIATNPSGIARIFEVKNRPPDNPLICHFHSAQQISDYVISIPETTRILLNHFAPGPISFLLDLPHDSPLKFATCGRNNVIARIPRHPIFLSIIQQVNEPLAAPSANTSGQLSPTTAEMVEKDLGKKIDGIVDGGSSTVGLESTIVDSRSDEIIILRQGAIGEREIRQLLPHLKVNHNSLHNQQIPGSKYRHYSPATPVLRINDLKEISNEKNAALILTDEARLTFNMDIITRFQEQNIFLLGLGSIANPDWMARNFYQTLARLDELQFSKAYWLSSDFGNTSIGHALTERMNKIVIR